eukprot:902217-Rhodomonas_salina.2
MYWLATDRAAGIGKLCHLAASPWPRVLSFDSSGVARLFAHALSHTGHRTAAAVPVRLGESGLEVRGRGRSGRGSERGVVCGLAVAADGEPGRSGHARARG